MIKLIFILIFLLLNISTPTSSCPTDCSCSAKSIVCTCNEDSWNYNDQNNNNNYVNQLVLSNFSNYLEYVENIIIHSCSSVVVLNGTFGNLKVKDSIKFIDIKKLSFSSYSFHNIKECPKQFVIQNSLITSLPSYTFTGLGNLNHFWIRNTTINKIHKLAFSGVKDVDYIYFRQVIIGHLEAGSFAQMTNIDKFFMRDQILLPIVGEHLFVGSNFKEIIFEKGEIIGSELFLMGVKCKKVTIQEMKLQLKVGNIKRIPTQEVNDFRMINCTANRISPALYYNHTKVLIKHCNINSIRGIQNIIPYNISSMTFENCKINQFHSHSIRGSRDFDNFSIIKSKIEHIHSKTFYESYITSMSIKDTTITNIDSEAFDTNKLNILSIYNTTIKFLSKEIFYHTSMNILSMESSSIGISINGKTFGSISEVDKLVIQNCIIDEPEEDIFYNSNIKTLEIINNTFTSPFKRKYFNKMITQNMLFLQNILICDPYDCEANALLTKNFPHSLEWKFNDNKCQFNNYDKEFCNKPVEYEPTHGLICQRRWLIDDCTCDIEYNNNSTDYIKTFPSKAKFLLIGDCKNIILVDYPDFEANFIHFYRIDDGISIEAVPKSVRRMFIQHSDLQLSNSYAFKDSHLDVLYFNNVFLPTMDDKVFYDMYIDTISIQDSNINRIGKAAFKGSIVKNIDIKNSNIYESGNLLDSANKIIIENSNLAKKIDYKVNIVSPSLSLKRDSSKLVDGSIASISSPYVSKTLIEKCLLIDTRVEDSSILPEVTALDKTLIAEDVTQEIKRDQLEASVKYKKSSLQSKSSEKEKKNKNVVLREPVSSVRVSTEAKKYTKKNSLKIQLNESIKVEPTEYGNTQNQENQESQITCKTQSDESIEKNEKKLEKEYLNNKKKIKIDFDSKKLNKNDVYVVGAFKVHKGSDIWACNSLSKSK
uniref:G_PROTEIN_RECEP_F3_4 domain-containing protein n=1 Tax=Parastrongyloides trichosuri TaxID=131310 RepID=A0A0N5A176_PARTI